MNWWTDWESNPARVACKASLRPGGRPKESRSRASLENGARTWFRATLSCSSGRRFHQISFPSVRPARIELASSEWHSEALPIDQGRMVGVPRIELGMHIGAGFTDPLSHQTWRHPIGCSGPNRTAYLVGMSHASCQCSTLRQRLRGLNSLACAAVHPCVRRIGGQPRS